MRYARLTATLAFIALITGLILWANSAHSDTTQVVAKNQATPNESLVGWMHYYREWPAVTTTTTTTAPAPPATTVISKTGRARNTVQVQQGGGPCDKPSDCPQLRQCENGGSYAHGTSSLFDGAYQFDHGSQWGMTPEQQDARADAMFAARGAAPWPKCGRFLR